MNTVLVLVLSMLVTNVWCTDNTTVGDLDLHVATEFLNLLAKQVVKLTGNCEKLQESDIELALYNRDQNIPTILDFTNPIEIDPNKKVIILIHGWVANKFRFVPEITDAYLKRYDANVITLDWSKLAAKRYTTAVCYLPQIAKIVANMLCLCNMSLENVHLVGHSLGGQMCGFIGQSVKNTCGKKIGRITALDPAGPLYQELPIKQRLDKSDANFVDVIHTNEGVLGYYGNLGHVDFHVNCGTFQLGCQKFPFILEAVKRIPVSLMSCHHSRSVEYMKKTIIETDIYAARKCSLCPTPCVPEIFNLNKVLMGENTPTSANGAYVVAARL